MNREIKFRAWDVEYQIMAYFELDNIVANGKIHYGSDEEPLFGEIPEIRMQFTGLTAKYGREIYEGDILLIGNSATERYYPNVVVRWKFNRWVFGTTCDWEFQERYIEEGKVEIIGNIYENSDLLEVPQIL